MKKLLSILLAVLRSVETVKIGFYVSLSSFGINILLNYMLIYGKFGAPEMGVTGAAIGTLAARVLELVIVACYVFFVDKKLTIRIKDFFVIDKKLFADYGKTAFPIILLARRVP